MKPAPFEYHAPESVDDAVALLREHGDEAKVLAGGQSLIPILAMRLSRYEHLVDIQRIHELAGISRTNGTLHIGATTRQRRDAERSAEVAEYTPLLAPALPHVGHFQIRNRGTVGGSIAHADPASELPAVALALDATIHVAGPAGPRTVPAVDFFTGTWTTTVEADEIVTGVSFPVAPPHSGYSVREFSRRHGDFALAGVAVALSLDAVGRVEHAACAFFGMGPTPMRSPEAEAALLGQTAAALATDESAAAFASAAVQTLNPTSDIHLSAENRGRVARHLTATALAEAATEAKGAE